MKLPISPISYTLTHKHLQKGLSLVEILMVISAISLIAFLIGSLPNTINLISKSNHLSMVREVATKEMEKLKSSGYEGILDESSVVDHRLGLLPQGSGLVMLEACDPVICTKNEELKKATITILWKENGKDQKYTLVTFISKEGR